MNKWSLCGKKLYCEVCGSFFYSEIKLTLVRSHFLFFFFSHKSALHLHKWTRWQNTIFLWSVWGLFSKEIIVRHIPKYTGEKPFSYKGCGSFVQKLSLSISRHTRVRSHFHLPLRKYQAYSCISGHTQARSHIPVMFVRLPLHINRCYACINGHTLTRSHFLVKCVHLPLHKC